MRLIAGVTERVTPLLVLSKPYGLCILAEQCGWQWHRLFSECFLQDEHKVKGETIESDCRTGESGVSI